MQISDILYPDYTYVPAVTQYGGDRYRASVTIYYQGERIERSGLIGPAFADVDGARSFVTEWAHQWVSKREEAAGAIRVARGSSAAALQGA
ncbi:hypothetical protein SAMN05216551_103179 [Chitinasiproducens palmae]|uniref:Uncharacterized protein n=2 Tax=Chitinasiproducens palmae TaxID=1770053 RepID=A0A1H2PNA3_9BURK|nr:hypothetical protein SAMN05216551_103179 [Chitinasiproducens palmae]